MVEAAFNVVLKHRLHNLSARNIAKELKETSSVAPIYRYFESMEDLTQAVIEKAKNILIDYTKKQYTKKSIWLSMGTGMLIFARDYGNLYRALFIEGNYFQDILLDFQNIMEKQMAKDNLLSDMQVKDRRKLLFNMWIITHGYASLICAGFIKDTKDETLISRLYEIGEIITLHAIKESKSAD